MAFDRTRPGTICAALPGAMRDHPFGPEPEAWKVGGRIFALISPGGAGVVLKCADAEQAAFLIEIGRARTAPYLTRGGWVLITWEVLDAGEMAAGDLADRLAVSHRTVAASLPQRLRLDRA